MQLADIDGVDYYPDLSLSPLFANLTTPAPHSLRVYEPGITLQSLQVFLSRSRCSLQELHIDGSSVPEIAYWSRKKLCPQPIRNDLSKISRGHVLALFQVPTIVHTHLDIFSLALLSQFGPTLNIGRPHR
ncbi:hypothetical protein C8R45DRAFT_1108131 [Mycena sanguinolenta]|nr:hypothetical protein C8R45DRAFT_1108131 [Mycena sanguinolenta]